MLHKTMPSHCITVPSLDVTPPCHTLAVSWRYAAFPIPCLALPLPRFVRPSYTSPMPRTAVRYPCLALPCPASPLPNSTKLCLRFDTQRYANTKHNSTMPGSTKAMQRDSEAMLANASAYRCGACPLRCNAIPLRVHARLRLCFLGTTVLCHRLTLRCPASPLRCFALRSRELRYLYPAPTCLAFTLVRCASPSRGRATLRRCIASNRSALPSFPLTERTPPCFAAAPCAPCRYWLSSRVLPFSSVTLQTNLPLPLLRHWPVPWNSP